MICVKSGFNDKNMEEAKLQTLEQIKEFLDGASGLHFWFQKMHRTDLSLRHVILLDRVQKQQKVSADEVKLLKAEKLIEGRSPNYYISARVADLTAQKARYIRNRAL